MGKFCARSTKRYFLTGIHNEVCKYTVWRCFPRHLLDFICTYIFVRWQKIYVFIIFYSKLKLSNCYNLLYKLIFFKLTSQVCIWKLSKLVNLLAWLLIIVFQFKMHSIGIIFYNLEFLMSLHLNIIGQYIVSCFINI